MNQTQNPTRADVPCPPFEADATIPLGQPDVTVPPGPTDTTVPPVAPDIAMPQAEPHWPADATTVTPGETRRARGPVPPGVWPPVEPSAASTAGATPGETGATEKCQPGELASDAAAIPSVTASVGDQNRVTAKSPAPPTPRSDSLTSAPANDLAVVRTEVPAKTLAKLHPRGQSMLQIVFRNPPVVVGPKHGAVL